MTTEQRKERLQETFQDMARIYIRFGGEWLPQRYLLTWASGKTTIVTMVSSATAGGAHNLNPAAPTLGPAMQKQT